MAQLRDIPQILPSDATNLPALVRKLQQTQELVRTLAGFLGDADLTAVNLARLRQIGLTDGNDNPVDTGSGGSTDTTPPPAPTGFTASGGLSHVFAEWDPPTYTQGGGNAQTNIYGATYSGTGPLPTFSGAVIIDSEVFTTSVASIPSEPSTTWRLWATHVTTAGIEGPPAGGTNGVEAKTGVDVSNMLDSLTEAAQRPGGPLTKTMFRADLFGIGPELDFNQEATPVGTSVGQLWLKPSTGATKTWNGTAWSTFNVPLPFIVNTTPTTIDGITYPAGVYMTQAIIYDLTALIARLGTAWIDNAMIDTLSASKLTAGSISVGNYLQSAGYTGVGVSEWRIDGNGVARFSGVIVSGEVIATSGSIGGAVIMSNQVKSSNYDGLGTGWRLHNNGIIYAGSLQVSNIGATRVFNTNASGANPVLKVGTALLLRGDGSGQLGDLDLTGDLSVSGSLQLGQTAYNTGTGVWAGKVGSVFKVSMGNPAGPYLLYDGTDIFIKSPTFDSFSASIPAGNLAWDYRADGDGNNAVITWPSRSVTVTGGKPPYNYQWLHVVSESKVEAPNNERPPGGHTMVLLGSATTTCTMQGGGEHATLNTIVSGYLGCLVTDSNGRNTFVRVLFTLVVPPIALDNGGWEGGNAE